MRTNMDITYNLETNKRFNYRVAAIITHNGHILLQTAADLDYWVLPGGRCKFGEDSKLATERELKEELGLDFSKLELVYVVENFFNYGQKEFHEMSHIYCQKLPVNTEYEDTNLEYLTKEIDGSPIKFKWFPKNNIHAVNLLPSFLKEELLKENLNYKHIIHRDKKET